MNNATLVLGNGAERAAAKTASLNGNAETNHLVSRNLGVTVERVRLPGVGQFIDAVQLGGFQRYGRWVQPDVGVAMALHQGAGVARVRFDVQDALESAENLDIRVSFL